MRLTPIILYIGAPSDALNIKNLLTTHEAQTLPKPRSFELRVQRYINFSNPPNVWPTFFPAKAANYDFVALGAACIGL